MESAKFADLGKRSRRTNVALNRQHLLAGWPEGQVSHTARLFRLFHFFRPAIFKLRALFKNVLSPLLACCSRLDDSNVLIEADRNSAEDRFPAPSSSGADDIKF